MADPYRFGMRSDATRALQAALAAAGFDPGPVDGIFGHATEVAVAAGRQTFGLGEGGVDAALLDRLGLRPQPKPQFDSLTGFALDRALAVLLATLKGRPEMTFLAGYRSYIIAALMLLTGIAGMLGIDIPSFSGQAPGDLVMEALAFFFLRQGLKLDASGK